MFLGSAFHCFIMARVHEAVSQTFRRRGEKGINEVGVPLKKQ